MSTRIKATAVGLLAATAATLAPVAPAAADPKEPIRIIDVTVWMYSSWANTHKAAPTAVLAQLLPNPTNRFPAPTVTLNSQSNPLLITKKTMKGRDYVGYRYWLWATPEKGGKVTRVMVTAKAADTGNMDTVMETHSMTLSSGSPLVQYASVEQWPITNRIN